MSYCLKESEISTYTSDTFSFVMCHIMSNMTETSRISLLWKNSYRTYFTSLKKLETLP